ncbi:hypothetical protein TNCV_1927371 [Trichonephila clavipes]|nr:hypothetical protein TNCV_1927371 [Trichonephila clavipes]
MASFKEKAQCVVWFQGTKSSINVQYKFRRCSGGKPPGEKLIKRRYVKEKGCVEDIHRSDGPSESEATAEHTSKCADASFIRSARIQRPPASTANATGPSCLGNPHPVSTPKRASDFCSPYQGFLDKADSNSPSPSRNGNDSEMANLPNDMELEMNLSQRSEPRSPSPQSQLTPCEQLK